MTRSSGSACCWPGSGRSSLRRAEQPLRFLITGGTGFVGGWIATMARDIGHDVTVIARDPSRAGPLREAGVEVVAGELTDAAAMDRVTDGVDVLVHAAAGYRYGRDVSAGMVGEAPTLAAAVFDAAGRGGIGHVIDISSAVVFRPHETGPRAGVTDIDSPRWSPRDACWGDPYLQSKVLSDAEADRARSEGVPISSVHPSMVSGPSDRGPGTSGAVLLSILRDRQVPDVTLGWCDVRDVAETVIAVADRPPGARYLVTVGALPFRMVAGMLDRVTGRSRTRVFLPRSLVRTTARFNDATGGRVRPDLPPRASLEYLLSTHGPIDGTSGPPALGLAYRPFEATLRDTLSWWAADGIVTRELVGRAAE